MKVVVCGGADEDEVRDGIVKDARVSSRAILAVESGGVCGYVWMEKVVLGLEDGLLEESLRRR